MSCGRAYGAFYSRMDSAIGIHRQPFARIALDAIEGDWRSFLETTSVGVPRVPTRDWHEERSAQGKPRSNPAIVNMRMLRIHIDGMRSWEHAFVNGPLLVIRLRGKGFPSQAFSKIVHRKRQMDLRSTRATKAWPLWVPETRKCAAQC